MGVFNELFLNELPTGWLCQCQLPITTKRSEPEPGIAIVRGEHADFRHWHPSGSDGRLVIEVADTSLKKACAKADIYRTAGVQEYWIINEAGQCVERHAFAEQPVTAPPQILPRDAQLAIPCDEVQLVLKLEAIFG